jgi:hypothetical protein
LMLSTTEHEARNTNLEKTWSLWINRDSEDSEPVCMLRNGTMWKGYKCVFGEVELPTPISEVPGYTCPCSKFTMRTLTPTWQWIVSIPSFTK